MALRVKVKIDGLEKVIKKMDRLGDAGSAAVRTGIYAVANNIMNESIRITPKDDGWLRNTWYVTKPGRGKYTSFSECGYGANYAHHVHEMPSTTNWSESGTGNKFLQKAFEAYKATIASEVATIANKEFNPDKTTSSYPNGGPPVKPQTGPKPPEWKDRGKKK